MTSHLSWGEPSVAIATFYEPIWGVLRVEMHQARVPQPLAPSLAQALTDSGRLTAAARQPPLLLDAAIGPHPLRIYPDGRVDFAKTPEVQALLVQCIKGILPTVDSPFVVGVDESGMGKEAANPAVAIVLLPAETRAELIVAGVYDCKKVAPTRLESLRHEVVKRALRTEVIQVAPHAASRAADIATAVGKKLLEWDDEGLLPTQATILIDQTDVPALQSAFGDSWNRFEGRIQVQPKADEEYVEVAAASILARASRIPGTGQRKQEEAEAGLFRISAWSPEDREQVLRFLNDLQHSYPDIGKWIGKEGHPGAVWSKVEGKKYELLVARMNDEVAGFSLSQKKDERNCKLSTFFVAPRFRHQHIGHRLLDIELRRMASEGARRVMVTFGHEEFGNMAGFFRDHGFTVDGISPQRYRDNSYEVIMGKRFRHGVVAPHQFRSFAEHDLFRMQGFNVKSLDATSFLALPTSSLVQGPAAKAARLLVRVTTDAQPETEVDEVRKLANTHDAAPVLVCSYGFPCDSPLPKDVEVLDVLVLERMFFPLRLQRPQDEDVVIPIKPQYANVLFPAPEQATFRLPKVGLRTTNVYYKVARGDSGLRRGARIFFYESEGGRGVFGVGQLESVLLGPPKKIYHRTRGLGAWSMADISTHTAGAKAAAYRFTGFRTFRYPLTQEAVKRMHPTFFPMTACRIPSAVGDQIVDQGGYK